MKSYRDLEVYRKAFDLAVRVHRTTMKLPKYEMYEQGSQVRRSSKSIKDTIVEGYGRRRYKTEFVKYLVYAQGSCDETTSQLEMIKTLHSRKVEVDELISEYLELEKQLNTLIKYVENNWLTNQQPVTSNQ
jgi:four helix bundle protein